MIKRPTGCPHIGHKPKGWIGLIINLVREENEVKRLLSASAGALRINGGGHLLEGSKGNWRLNLWFPPQTPRRDIDNLKTHMRLMDYRPIEKR